MRAQLQRLTERRRPRRDRLREHPAAARPAPVDPDALAEPEQRVREAGGPEDVATYACGCGYQFEASVSTTVACPHCGSGQAW